MTVNMYRVSFQGPEDILKLDSGDGYTATNILKSTELYTLNG